MAIYNVSPFHSRPSHSFWGFVWLVVFCVCLCVGACVVLCFLFLFPLTMLRFSSCLPKLTTVRAVMVRAALEKKNALAFSVLPLESRGKAKRRCSMRLAKSNRSSRERPSKVIL